MLSLETPQHLSKLNALIAQDIEHTLEDLTNNATKINEYKEKLNESFRETLNHSLNATTSILRKKLAVLSSLQVEVLSTLKYSFNYEMMNSIIINILDQAISTMDMEHERFGSTLSYKYIQLLLQVYK